MQIVVVYHSIIETHRVARAIFKLLNILGSITATLYVIIPLGGNTNSRQAEACN